MKNDDLLKELARAAREDDSSGDPRWEALSGSALGPEDEAELRRMAERSGKAKAAYEAFRPLDADELEAMTDAVLSRSAEPAVKGEEEAAPQRGATLVPFRRKGPVLGGVVGVLAMAAAVALFFQSAQSPVQPPIPSYEIVIGHGDLVERSQNGAAASIPRFAPGSLCEIVLRPAKPIEGEIAVRTALMEKGQIRPWSPPIEISPEGAIRVAGPVEQIFPGISEGEWELWFLLGSPEALPERLDPDTIDLDKEGIQILRTHVVLVGRPL